MFFNNESCKELRKVKSYLDYKICVLEYTENKTIGDIDLLKNLKIIRKYILVIIGGLEDEI